ncbi:MAG: tetratricopeptide repeat protein [Symploca sp. SIO3C6]|nr:tetratricopeptide repeat protein [Symploca sp. SIO3C6]
MTVTDTASDEVSSWNRQTYQRLKLALCLGLRRQLFVAVCDDLSLRNRLAGKLQTQLARTSVSQTSQYQGYPQLVSLSLNLNNPNPLAEIAQWLAQHRQSAGNYSTPAFQILGIEGLTRQSPRLQRLFLRHLQTTPRYLPRLESTLLLWLPRPWFHTIVQSVPEFWQWHTGVFEFEGEPTPLPPVGAYKPETSLSSMTSEQETPSFKEDLRQLLVNDLAQEQEQLPLREITWEKPDASENGEQHLPEIGTNRASRENDALSLAADANGKENQTGLMNSSKIKGTAAETEATAVLTSKLEDTEARFADANSESDLVKSDHSISNEKSQIASSQLGEFPSVVEEELKATENREDEEDNYSHQTPLNQSEAIEASVDTEDGESSLGLTETADEYDLQASELSGTDASEVRLESEQEPPSEEFAEPAEAFLALGNYYRHLIEHGDASEENLETALRAYEQALPWLEDNSPQVSEVLNDIGNFYWMLSRYQTTAAEIVSYLQQAIQAYQLALTKLNVAETPQTYAMIENNLGAVYGDLAHHQDQVENLEFSIRAYEEALRYRLPENDPIKYASTQNNLGTAYWNLAQHYDPIQNLRAATAAYNEALSHYDPEAEPLNWAMIQNNLGTAYWNLAQYEKPEAWLKLALFAYQDALKYRTLEATAAAHAATQNNLGTAYWHLADRCQENPGARAEYLQKCIEAYEQALEAAGCQPFAHQPQPTQRNSIAVNFDVFATYNNLGLAHYQLATELQSLLEEKFKSVHLEAALHQHVQVCIGTSAQSDSYQIASNYIIKTIRALYSESGISGQNLALSKIPGHLLPEILPRL